MKLKLTLTAILAVLLLMLILPTHEAPTVPTQPTIRVSLLWVRGSGSNNTLIRMKTDSYPSTTDDGTRPSPGISYHYSRAWSEK